MLNKVLTVIVSLFILWMMAEYIVNGGNMNSCQACDVHGEHDRCTGENTLGTRSCECGDLGHPKDRCPDCGEFGERKGHQTCQIPRMIKPG